MYEFSSKSQLGAQTNELAIRCLRYCKCTSFQANHNAADEAKAFGSVVCDTANVRVFKQITTFTSSFLSRILLFAILQMYEFSSKSQHSRVISSAAECCLRYCKCTSFQANHNQCALHIFLCAVVCDTANVRVFKQITTGTVDGNIKYSCLRYCKSTSFQANHNLLHH